MIISKRKARGRRVLRKDIAALKLSKNGHITLSAALVNLLEIDDAEKDGVVFGYEDKASYIGYSFDSEAFKGRFKQGERSFRFGSVEERDNIILTSLSHIDDLQFPITMIVDPEDFVIHKTVKLYRLNYHNPN